MLANMSQSNAVLAAAGGQDPITGALQAGQDLCKTPNEQVKIPRTQGTNTWAECSFVLVLKPLQCLVITVHKD